MCFAPQRRALFRHLNFQKWSENGVFCTCWLRNVLRATTACTFSTSQLPKVVRTMVCFVHVDFENVLRATTACTFSTSQLPKVVRPWCVLYILTWKCASRHNGVHFFDIATSKSGPNHGVFCTFWLGNVLRATTACNFSSLIWPAGSAPAALASLLFDPPEPQIIGKTQWIATFLPFRASPSSFSYSLLLFSLLIFLFSLPLPYSAFHLSILSEVWLLNFLRKYVEFIWSRGSAHHCFGQSESKPTRILPLEKSPGWVELPVHQIYRYTVSVAQMILWTWCCTALVSSDLTKALVFTWLCCCLKVLPSCMTAVEPSVMVRINTRDTRPQCRICCTGPRGAFFLVFVFLNTIDEVWHAVQTSASINAILWNYRMWSKALPETGLQ